MNIRKIAALIVLVLALAACGDDQPDPAVSPVPLPPTLDVTEPTEPEPSPTVTATATADATETEAAEERTLVYFLARAGGDRLWVEPVSFTHDGDDTAVARAAITELLTASVPDGLDRPIPEGTELLDVSVEDRILFIDLSEEMATNPGVGSEGEGIVAEMLAHTGAQFPTVDAIRLLVEGEEINDLWGHVDWSMPIGPTELRIVPIDVTEATGTDDGTIELIGTANTFEASIDVIVVDSSGATVEESFITATCGSGCRGDWTHTVQGVGPGDYEVTLREPDPSGGEGFAPFEVTVTVTVPG